MPAWFKRSMPNDRVDPAAPRDQTSRSWRRNAWLWFGWLAGLLALLWVLRDFDLERLRTVLATADYRFLLPLPLLIAFEQLIRAFKWRQFLFALRPIGVWRLFGAIMVGYLSNHVVPVRVSPLVRAWLVARLEDMRVGTVLASIALDRIVDGFVFVAITLAVLAFVAFPDEAGTVREGLIWGVAGSLAAFSALVAGLLFLRRLALRGTVLPKVLLRWLPARLARPMDTFAVLFADGIVLPRAVWRRAMIVVASVAIKFMATTHFLFAGLAFGVLLAPMEYVFTMVFLGFLIILVGMLRIVGGFTVGAVFVLGGFGVEVETALAMAIIVQAASFLTLAVTGAAALWIEGISLGELRARGAALIPRKAIDKTKNV
jgi:uncharacterized membrane protein YbhN (UPF0104 family)